MHRRNRLGLELAPDERVDFRTALLTYTRFAAYATFDEGRRGVLAPGALGDLVVLPEDPFRMDADTVETLEPDLVVVGGAVRYGG
jgi:predicted amidohydrolase YtcJ